LHLKTQMLVDSLGRTTKVTDPNAFVHYTVYRDAAHEVRDYDWHVPSSQPIGPVRLTREDRPHQYTETLTFTAPVNYTWPSAPDGSEGIGTVQSLSRSIVNDAGQTVFTDQYFTLSGTSYSPLTPTLGSAWTASNPTAGNYYRTEMAYDERGRLK